MSIRANKNANYTETLSTYLKNGPRQTGLERRTTLHCKLASKWLRSARAAACRFALKFTLSVSPVPEVKDIVKKGFAHASRGNRPSFVGIPRHYSLQLPFTEVPRKLPLELVKCGGVSARSKE